MRGTIRAAGTVNGVYHPEVVITINGVQVAVETATAVTPEPPFEPAPEPTPTPPPESQPPLAGWRGPRLNWAALGGRQSVQLTGSEVMTWQFTTTANPGYSGAISVAEMTGFEGVTRRIWISDFPGGEPIGRRAVSEGNSLRKISWAQSSAFLRQKLEPNTTYYLNVQNVAGCAGRCGMYLTFNTSGAP